MQAAELIRAVERAGGRLEPDGDGLVGEAPEPLPPPIMTALREHKTEIIDFLNRPLARVILLHRSPDVPEEWYVDGCASPHRNCDTPCRRRATRQRSLGLFGTR